MAFERIVLVSGLLLSTVLSPRVALAGCDTYQFVSDYIRMLGALENIRAKSEQELTASGTNQMADCVRNMKMQL